ncbi:glycerol 3-phosphate dehydrogenase (quinone) subunit A [Haladaptatus litoreus]|uniref:Glycerol 3-phosphate dehydrogenase (Quinone) subunit A n=1 Tax=Haladaptatus litoreus TaxID=553468 RepID=A0A1N7BH86_9EURY|nr:FAD-dependent oxidoreductase [Haladaptatus litoreus]SIR50690.1 glycerol 3-phosphate dehydrogenase (quinone) subunit A [Haladaptatus litoreus]
MVGKTDVLILGGGITGTAIARDLGLRGLDTIVVERGRLADGATGNMHGLLHSGARYAVADPDSARDCIEENRTLRNIANHCLDETGGYFVQLPEDDESYFERSKKACLDCGIDVESVFAEEIREEHPYLSSETERAFRVPDAVIHPFPLTVANAVDVREHGGTVETHAEVVDVLVEDGTVAGAEVRHREASKTETIRAEHVVNATGAWAESAGAMAGIDIPMRPSKGVMVVVDFPSLDTVVNRCRPAADGDIVLPHENTAIIGTTSVEIDNPDDYTKAQWEEDLMIEEASKTIPDISTARVVRSYWGVRPLFGGTAADFEDGRAQTRDFVLLDHGERDDRPGMTTIVGGKLTTYRQMAETVSDHVCSELGVSEPCRTATEPLPGRDDPDELRDALDEFGPLPPAEELASDVIRD